jgi:tetratricopeptide (TPR) repeat protein
MKLLIACLLVASAALAESPAEVGIRKAQAEIASRPDHYGYYNELATAYLRRARETSDVGYYQKAEEALDKGLAIAPDNFEGLKLRTRVLLGTHQYARALELAAKLNKQTPDDVAVYGYLAEANAELGNYQAAAEAAQWMLNIRPGNRAGLATAGYLREMLGYIDPAIEVTRKALDATPFQETEERAWLLVRLAHLNVLAGNLPQAETCAASALGLFPGYPAGLDALAEVRIAQQRYDEAVSLLRKGYDQAPRVANLYAIGKALELAGRKGEAGAAFAEFERKALGESGEADNANRELIAYYVDVANKPAEALRLAEREIARRHDVSTLDCYASALAATGDTERAAAEMHQAQAAGARQNGGPTNAFPCGGLNHMSKSVPVLPPARSGDVRE